MIRLAILLVLVGFLTAGEALSQDKITATRSAVPWNS